MPALPRGGTLMPPARNIATMGLLAYLRLLANFGRSRLSALFWSTDTRSAEITFGMIAVGWFIVLAWSDAFDASNLYDYLARVAPQSVWGGGMAILGVAQLMLAVFAPQHEHRDLRCLLWFLSLAVWSYVALVSLLAVPVTTAAAVYGTMTIGSVWGFLRTWERG